MWVYSICRKIISFYQDEKCHPFNYWKLILIFFPLGQIFFLFRTCAFCSQRDQILRGQIEFREGVKWRWVAVKIRVILWHATFFKERYGKFCGLFLDRYFQGSLASVAQNGPGIVFYEDRYSENNSLLSEFNAERDCSNLSSIFLLDLSSKVIERNTKTDFSLGRRGRRK